MISKAKKNETIECPACSGPMICVEKRYRQPRGATSKYRIRKFKCELCDHEETIYADGEKDLQPADTE
jgi:hypothetical protein